MNMRKRLGPVAVGALTGFAVILCLLLAWMLFEPPAHSGDKDPLPNFRAGNFEWRVMYIGLAFFVAATIGGLGGGIVGRMVAFLTKKKGGR